MPLPSHVHQPQLCMQNQGYEKTPFNLRNRLGRIVIEKLSLSGEHSEHPKLIHEGLCRCDLYANRQKSISLIKINRQNTRDGDGMSWGDNRSAGRSRLMITLTTSCKSRGTIQDQTTGATFINRNKLVSAVWWSGSVSWSYYCVECVSLREGVWVVVLGSRKHKVTSGSRSILTNNQDSDNIDELHGGRAVQKTLWEMYVVAQINYALLIKQPGIGITIALLLLLMMNLIQQINLYLTWNWKADFLITFNQVVAALCLSVLQVQWVNLGKIWISM